MASVDTIEARAAGTLDDATSNQKSQPEHSWLEQAQEAFSGGHSTPKPASGVVHIGT